MNPLYEEEAEEDLNQRKLRSMDRKVLDRSAIENTEGYEKVKHSPSVKRLLERIDDYHDFMIRTKIPDMSGTEQESMHQIAKVNGAVVSRMQEMLDYLVRKAEGYADKTKRYRNVMRMCAHEAMKIRTQMDYVLKIQENCFYHLRTTGEVPYSGQSYEQVLVSKDLNIFQEKDSTERTYLGGGQMNTIYTMEDTSRDNQVRALKEGQASLDLSNNTNNEVIERLMHQKQESKGKLTMNTAYRDVAVSIIDKLFNLNAAVETSFARSKRGEQSSMMDVAKGSTLDDVYTYSDEAGKKEVALYKQIAVNEEALLGKESPKSKQAIKKAQKRQIIDTSSAKFIESTFNLAALDVIIGHVDRHYGNIMASEEGVKGIDNDMAFGMADVMELGKNHQEFTRDQIREKVKDGGVDTLNANHQAYLFLDTQFPEVTEAFRQKILRVPASAVKGALKGLIRDEQIEACVKRVEALQDYLRNNARIIDSFDQLSENHGEAYNFTPGQLYQNFNILSQVKNSSGANQINHITAQMGPMLATDEYGNHEISIIGRYVEKKLGDFVYWENGRLKTYTLGCFIVPHLMHMLAEAAKADDFDLKKMIENGELDKMFEEAKALAVVDKEKDDEQKKAKQAS
ncbi:MAG: hypothetical protein ACI4HQ_11635 [Acetatifactor sp.]